MPFWSGETLKVRLPTLVTEYEDERIDCNSYTLRMGAEYFCTSDGKRPVWRRAKKQTLSSGESFVIPAGQFAFLETREEITVPRETMAFISVKATVKWEGLINVSGFHVDPGYKGKLIFSVYNAGPSPIILEEGMSLFLIWYALLDNKETEMIRRKDGGKSISRELVKKMSGEILSLQSLSNEIGKVRTSMRIQWTIFAAAAALMFVIIGATANFILQRGLTMVLEAPAASQTSASLEKPSDPLEISNVDSQSTDTVNP